MKDRLPILDNLVVIGHYTVSALCDKKGQQIGFVYTIYCARGNEDACFHALDMPEVNAVWSQVQFSFHTEEGK